MFGSILGKGKDVKMSLEESDILTMCCECRAIKIDENLWLRREDNKKLYDNYLKKFGENISHGFCPKDLRKSLEEAERVNKKYHKNN